MAESVKIGKFILATLTTGMYKDARMIYREYIQNSADQIDTLSADDKENSLRKTVVISIKPDKKSIIVRDQATGIPEADFRARLLNVADSHKDPSKNKGFRGIGRLAGLSYCSRLVFRSSAANETSVSILEMDGTKLQSILHDANDHSTASDVMEKISKYSCKRDAVNSWDVFFEVELVDVNEIVGKELLDVDSVTEFIRQIAPVPFSKSTFSFGEQIKANATTAGVEIEEYTVQVNGSTMTKPYKDDIIDSAGSAIEKFTTPIYKVCRYHGEVLAWGWFMLNATGKQLVGSKNPERKIRLRKGNIQIGFSDFLDGYFPEERSNGYMVGEIYLLSKKIQPNGDRNGLEVSEATTAFENWCRNDLFRELWGSVRQASSLVTAKKGIADYKSAWKELESLAEHGAPSAILNTKKVSLEAAYEKALQKVEILKRAKDSAHDQFSKLVIETVTEDLGRIESSLKAPKQVEIQPQSTKTIPGGRTVTSAQPKTKVIVTKTSKSPRDIVLEKIIGILTDELDIGVMDALKVGNKILDEIPNV